MPNLADWRGSTRPSYSWYWQGNLVWCRKTGDFRQFKSGQHFGGKTRPELPENTCRKLLVCGNSWMVVLHCQVLV